MLLSGIIRLENYINKVKYRTLNTMDSYHVFSFCSIKKTTDLDSFQGVYVNILWVWIRVEHELKLPFNCVFISDNAKLLEQVCHIVCYENAI